MADWLVALIVIVVLLIVLAIVVWWWMNRRNQPAVAAAAPAAAAAVVADGPYGPGSAAPLAGGAAPAGYTIKGNADSMLFHTPESPYYSRTIAEVWFRTAGDAEKAGFKPYTR
jgi:hypothetical protein